MVAIIETEWKSGTWRPWLTTFAPILVGKPNDFEPFCRHRSSAWLL